MRVPRSTERPLPACGALIFPCADSPPIRSRYGQTFWTMMDAVPLPKEIVERFDGKTMAITGVRL